MGNSHGGHHKSKKGSAGRGGDPSTGINGQLLPAQHVQSLPRDGGRSQQPPHHKVFNGGFKVLPERIPGQKLRLTDNGSVLHNGGTLSGRRVLGGGSELDAREVDPELLQVLRHRSDSVQDLRLIEEDEDDERNMHVRIAKKYHSNPDLLNCPTDVDCDPSGMSPDPYLSKAAQKKLLRKTKMAALPPPHPGPQPSSSSDANGVHVRRRFASFLKPSGGGNQVHKKGAEDPRSRNSVASMCHQDDSQSLPIVPNPPPPPLARVNADVVTTKLDSRDNSMTYVLERRSNGSVLSAASMPSNNYGNNKNTKQMLRGPPISNLQNRVQSMDSIAYDEDHQQRRYAGPRYLHPHEGKPPPHDQWGKSQLQNEQNVPLGRRLSNRSNQLHNADGQNLFNDMHSLQPGYESNQPRTYFYGTRTPTHDVTKQLQQQQQQQQNHKEYLPQGELISGSLDRRQDIDYKNFQRTPANLAVQRASAPSPIREMHHEEVERTSRWNRDLENFSKSKIRQMNTKDVVPEVAKLRQRDPIDFKRPLLENVPVHGLHDDMSSEDEMDINMQLRPTLPKRLPTLPRFSPTQVWRSFSLEELTAAGNRDDNSDDRSSNSEDEEEGDVFEDRIHRIARPMAPPKVNNEKSGDSGISPGAHSPTPALYDFNAVLTPDKHGSECDSAPIRHQSLSPVAATLLRQKHSGILPTPISPLKVEAVEKPITVMDERKPPAWTPEEDLASDFDTGSGDQAVPHRPWNTGNQLGPDIVACQPKLTSRKDMFFMHRSSEHIDTITSSLPHSNGSKDHGRRNKNRSGIVGGKNDAGKNGSEDPTSLPQKYNSVRKLKRSLSGALQVGNGRMKSLNEAPTSLDENWSLSRSLPNSLHSGLESDKKISSGSSREDKLPPKSANRPRQSIPKSESGPVYPVSVLQEKRFLTDLDGRPFPDQRRTIAMSSKNTDDTSREILLDNDRPSSGMSHNRNGRIVYLPKYKAIEVTCNPMGNDYRRRTYSDLGGSSSQSATGQANGWVTGGSYVAVGGVSNNIGSGHSDLGCGDGRKGHRRFGKPKKFTYQSTVRQIERKQLEQKLSEVVAVREKQRNREMDAVNKVEEEFQKKRDREKTIVCQQLKSISPEDTEDLYHRHSSRDAYPHEISNGIEHRISVTNHNGHTRDPYMDIDKQQSPGSGIFSGISKWMKRQQQFGKANYTEVDSSRSLLRQAPEGASAPSSPGNQFDEQMDGDHLGSRLLPPMVPRNQQSRNQVVIGAKFSSGRTPILSRSEGKTLRHPEDSHANRIWIT